MESDRKGQSSGQGIVSSLSVEESNKLRKQLGLRPLRVATTENDRAEAERAKKEAEKVQRNKALKTKNRIAKFHNKRMENSILAARPIAASLDDDDYDEDKEEPDDDPAVWVAKMKNRRSEQNVKVKDAQTKRKRQKLNDLSEKNIADVNLDHADELMKDHTDAILTLKDSHVIPDADGDDEIREDVLQSIDIAQRMQKRALHSVGPSLKYDPTDDKEFDKKSFRGEVDGVSETSFITGKTVPDTKAGSSANRKSAEIASALSLSIALGEGQSFQDDYELANGTEQTFSRRRKTKKGKSRKRKRSIETELREALDKKSVPTVSGEKPPLPLSRASAIRAAALKNMGDGFEGEEEEDIGDAENILQKSLRQAREKARTSETDASVQRILKIIDQADENGEKDGEFDSASASIIFNEMEQYVRTISPVEAESESSEDESTAVKATNVSAAESPASGTNIPDASSKMTDSPPSQPVTEIVSTSNPNADTPENRSADVGIAGALARFRAMGDLRSRPEQLGRARDEQIDWKELDSKVKVPAGQRNIKLTYTDESGHELTPKEAFRLMCHKFHGKGPSKNKRELRLRRQLQKMRLQQMANDDTPLGSSSALRNETRRTGAAHVVLSGSSVAPVASAIEQDSLGKVNGPGR